MRIIRIARGGITGFAVVQDDGGYRRAEGDLYGGLRVTDTKIEPDALLAPVVPTTVYAIGLNYRAHAVEMDKPIPEHPVVTMKSPTVLLDPGGEIVLPRFLASDSVDYECELAVVIGRSCRNVTPEEAYDYVFGYTAANDVSARDWQNRRQHHACAGDGDPYGDADGGGGGAAAAALPGGGGRGGGGNRRHRPAGEPRRGRDGGATRGAVAANVAECFPRRGISSATSGS